MNKLETAYRMAQAYTKTMKGQTSAEGVVWMIVAVLMAIGVGSLVFIYFMGAAYSAAPNATAQTFVNNTTAVGYNMFNLVLSLIPLIIIVVLLAIVILYTRYFRQGAQGGAGM